MRTPNNLTPGHTSTSANATSAPSGRCFSRSLIPGVSIHDSGKNAVDLHRIVKKVVRARDFDRLAEIVMKSERRIVLHRNLRLMMKARIARAETALALRAGQKENREALGEYEAGAGAIFTRRRSNWPAAAICQAGMMPPSLTRFNSNQICACRRRSCDVVRSR